jgi:hypothetical protein
MQSYRFRRPVVAAAREAGPLRRDSQRLHDTRASGRSRDSFSCNGLFLALRMPPERMSHCLRNPIANDERGSQFQSGMNLICMLLVVPFPQIRFAYWYSSVFLAGMTSATLFHYFFLKKKLGDRVIQTQITETAIYIMIPHLTVWPFQLLLTTPSCWLSWMVRNVSIIYGLTLNIYIERVQTGLPSIWITSLHYSSTLIIKSK